MDKLIGREREADLLKKYYNSKRPEFIAIYGRRRVGKTYMVRKFFKDKFDFYATGIIDGTYEEELKAFNNALVSYGYNGNATKNWMDAFLALADLLKTKASKKKRCVVFIDELPCLDTQNSGFVHAFDYFWNSRASWIGNIFLVICGSATSCLGIFSNAANVSLDNLLSCLPFIEAQDETAKTAVKITSVFNFIAFPFVQKMVLKMCLFRLPEKYQTALFCFVFSRLFFHTTKCKC